jgi:hypothetical protein
MVLIGPTLYCSVFTTAENTEPLFYKHMHHEL